MQPLFFEIGNRQTQSNILVQFQQTHFNYHTVTYLLFITALFYLLQFIDKKSLNKERKFTKTLF